MKIVTTTNWEDTGSERQKSQRLKVPGGWIVRSWLNDVTQIFIKDPKHTWELKDEQTAVV